jgi:hypothetical protein
MEFVVQLVMWTPQSMVILPNWYSTVFLPFDLDFLVDLLLASLVLS